MATIDRRRPVRPSFSERHRVGGSLLVLLVLVCFAAVTAAAVGAVLVRILDLVTGIVGGGS